MPTKQEIIDGLLRRLQTTSSDIEGLAIVTPDGMMIANHLTAVERVDADATAAMGAAMGGLGTRVARTLKIGEMQEITIRGADSSILLFTIEHRAALLVQVKAKTNLGLVLLEARKAQQELKQLL